MTMSPMDVRRTMARLAARAWPLLALLGAVACAAPDPRIPFQYGDGWHVVVLSGERATTDRYIDEHPIVGIEVIRHDPGTGGWGWEAGFRFGTDDGTDTYFERRPSNPEPEQVVVDVERDSDYYELSLGARQTYRPGARVQPYFSIGGSVLKSNNVDHYPAYDGTAQDFPPRSDHFHKLSMGIYGRVGLMWNVLRDQIREDSEGVITLDVRGLYGDDLSFVELVLGVGYGK
jgi:hypothetical protein